jgi:hypothetical protein
MSPRTAVLMLGIFVAMPTQPSQADEFVSLCDGDSLAGWTALPGGSWEVVDGAIVGTSPESEKKHGILLSEKTYGDFVVRLKFKSLAGNSGLYFRCEQVDHAVAVKGFQAEINAEGPEVGGLYETLGRAWVTRPAPERIAALFKKNDWNEMAVAAVGSNVTVTINGEQTAQLKNDPGIRRGHLGLQLHGGQEMHVLFKDIEIKEVTNPAQPVILETIHDLSRALPATAEPESDSSLAASRQPPAGAIVLFDGSDLAEWQGAEWVIQDGTLETREGNLATKRSFADCQLHVEWRIVDADSHGNSGVYLMDQYEVQIFNSHDNRAPIYADGTTGAIYGQYPPLVNACRPAGQWEVFDIAFVAPRFDDTGKLEAAATMTVRQNGVLIQDNVALTGPTDHLKRPPYRQQADRMPLQLQYHGDRLQFCNIWIVEM